MQKNAKSGTKNSVSTAQRKSHKRFLRYASLHSVNAASATITPEMASDMVRHYLEAEAAL